MTGPTRRDGKVAGIVVAAGAGQRMGAGRPKAMLEIGGRPLYRLAADALTQGGCGRVVIVVPPDGDWVAQVSAAEPSAIVVPGGATRQESVFCGLQVLHDDPPGVVLVHDAARALAPPVVVSRVVESVIAGHRVVTPVVPVVDTIRQVRGDDSALLDRAELRAVQTPQGFAFETLWQAHQAAVASGAVSTDDVSLCELLGQRVWLVDGDQMAFKITTSVDLAVAEMLAKPVEGCRIIPR